MAPADRKMQPVNLPGDWSPESWRSRTALQLPQYPDAGALEATLGELRALPPLVTSWEILALKQQLAEAQEGKRFLLQGGDCAESFAEHGADNIRDFFRAFLQMAVVLTFGADAMFWWTGDAFWPRAALFYDFLPD